MAGMQETDHITLKNGITYLLQDAKARAKLDELRNEVMEKSGIAIQDDEPTGDELVWIDTDESGVTHIIPEIDDTQESTVDTWSSQKIAEKFAGVLPFGEVTTKIPSGADLNDYNLPGVYAIGGNSTAATIANMPSQSAGTLRVFSSAGNAITASSAWKYLIQEYIVFTGARYQRFGGSGSGTAVTWSAWETIYTSADISVPIPVSQGGTGADNAADARANLGLADCIVEQGTSGVWTYRKWKTGIAECWCRGYASLPSGWSTSGFTLNLPFTFIELQTSSVQFHNYQIDRAYTVVAINNVTSINVQTWCESAISNAIYTIEVKGLWKY